MHMLMSSLYYDSFPKINKMAIYHNMLNRNHFIVIRVVCADTSEL